MLTKKLNAYKKWLEFILIMTEKEIKARYKHATLGFLWAILNPLLQMLVIGFVFQFFVPINVENYFIFLFSSLLPWNYFSFTLGKTTPMIIFERSLIKKAKFPIESIVISVLLSNLFHLVISLLLFIAFLLIFTLITGKVFITFLGILTLFLGLFWLSILTLGFSLLFSSLNARFRDVNFVVQAILPLWFYATPVLYSLDLLPNYLAKLLYLNPMTSIIELFRSSLMNIPQYNPSLNAISLASTLIFLALGVYVFKKMSPYFDDWI